MSASGPGRNRAWLVRNFWLFAMMLNIILVFVLLVVLAVLLSG